MKAKVFFAGDYLNTKGNPEFVDQDLKDIISSSDLAICNLEGPIDHKYKNGIKKAGPHLYQHKDSIKFLKETGFGLVSLANNHIYDYGQVGLEETINELNRMDLKYVGAGLNFDEAYKPMIININGIKLGIIAACENEFGCLYEESERGGYPWVLHYRIIDNILKLKDSCDFVILISHAGVEDIEIPIKEWREIYKFYCSIGVNLVIGHHPHVPQGYEIVDNSVIFYSLGNFYFDKNLCDKYNDSYSVIVEFYKIDKNVKYMSYSVVFHSKKDNRTCLSEKDKVSFNLDRLNNFLSSPDYEIYNAEICKELFYNYYQTYYEIAMNKIPEKFLLIDKLKFYLKKFLKKHILGYNDSEYRNLLLLHNIKIDSHRFVVQRALSLIIEEKR